MKHTLKKVSVLLMAVVLVLSLAVPAFAKAEDGVYEVNYVGGKDGFTFVTDGTYTDSDLFAKFKKVIPGDTLTQVIDIINSSTESDFIKLYLQAVPHNEDNKPVAAELENTNIADMVEFLNQFDLTVTNKENNKIIFAGKADELGNLEKPVYLASLDHGDATALEVVLKAPIEMDNQFAKQFGEIDWKFLAEQYNYSSGDSDDETYKVTIKKLWEGDTEEQRPDSIKVKVLRKGKVYKTVTLSAKNNWRCTLRDLDYKNGWSVEEVNVPKGYEDSYEAKGRVFTITNTMERQLAPTGQLNWPIPVLFIAGLLLIATGASLLQKGKKNA